MRTECRRSYASIALLCVASIGCAGKEVTDYFAQVAGTMDGNTYWTARHGTAEPPADPYSDHPRTNLFSVGVTAIPGGSMLIGVAGGPAGSPWGAPVIKVSGADGWFQLERLYCTYDGCAATLSATIRQHAPESFVLGVASVQYGFAKMPFRLTRVGTGDVQVNLSWHASSAIDLHVIEPSGEELYQTNRGPSATGGQFDLGPDGDCAADGRTENIFWPNRRAPRGSYTVLVEFRSVCGRPLRLDQTRYAVTVNVKGQEPQVFYGNFVAADIGTPGSRRTITTFTY